jgi:hypothetical protein
MGTGVGRAGEREGVLRAAPALNCGMPLNAIIQILAAALAWAALGAGLFFFCIRALEWAMH